MYISISNFSIRSDKLAPCLLVLRLDDVVLTSELLCLSL